MPIRQEQILEQMKEARAAHQSLRQLHDLVTNYLAMLPSRYPNDKTAGEIANGLSYAVRLHPIPDDRITFDNERYYNRHARANSEFRKVQEMKRRAQGIPTQDEAIAMLHARNAIIREGGEIAQTYAQFNQGPRERKRAPAGKGKKQETIFPRDDPDDPELEFETLEELAPIANLPTGAVAVIIDPLTGENNSQEGFDNPAEQAQDSDGNPAKESGE